MKKTFFSLVAVVVSMTLSAQTTNLQVWDLGAQQFTDSITMLSVAEINSWFTEKAGTSGVTVSNITASDSVNFVFNGGGKSNHRLRTTNTELTRYDSKSLTDASGYDYTGYLYSNSGSNTAVYIQQNYRKNDKVEFFVGSNGGTETYVLESPTGVKTEGLFTNAAKIEKLTFYIGENGAHKLYGTDEKLVVARIIRTPAAYATLSGTVTAPASIPSGYQLVFTHAKNGISRVATPSAGSYTIDSLAIGYDYTVSLQDANGFIVTSESPVTIASQTQNYNVEIKAVTIKTISGTVSGLPADLLSKLTFSFEKPDTAIYEPQLTVTPTALDTTYTLQVESGILYVMHALNVNDYNFSEDTLITSSDIANHAVYFTLKPTYKITVVPTVAVLSDLASATFTFTNLNEDGYVYEFTGTDNIYLRNGVYSVKVTNSGAFVQLLTSNLKVNGAAVSKTIDFSSNISEWNFNVSSFTEGGYSNSSETYTYQGLEFTGGKSHNAAYLYMSNGGTVRIPVKGACEVQVKACYSYKFQFESEAVIDSTSNSTSQIDTWSYVYSGSAGYVTISFLATSYVNSISVVESIAYKNTLTVGTDKDYTTINDALTAIRKMSRPNSERVKIMIDPGNYEEMLAVNVANVSFVNASATPSIALSNAGVDIDANAVRITGYYGHGYNYYSMGSNYMWNARTLAVNKENGYTDMVNPGGGNTLWNSTVIVSAAGFEAENIIFENSYNQYISQRESEDVVVEIETQGKGTRPTAVGSTAVQNRSFRERASALGFSKTADRAFLNNCRIIGRQDALYGDQGARVACYKGVLMGACDYIFGGMTLACYKTELAMNTTDDSNDVAYLTAAKNTSGRGYLFYQCHIVSATPAVETATTNGSKPGLFGRPWDINGEAVFYKTTIDTTTCPGYSGSLIAPAGWNNGLTSTGSANSVEYGTIELSRVDNSANRVAWATVLTTPVLADATVISCFNFTKGSDDWDPLTALMDEETALPETVSELGINLYAVEGCLQVKNISEQTEISLFLPDGRMVYSRRISADVAITLSRGIYLVRTATANGSAVKKVYVK